METLGQMLKASGKDQATVEEAWLPVFRNAYQRAVKAGYDAEAESQIRAQGLSDSFVSRVISGADPVIDKQTRLIEAPLGTPAPSLPPSQPAPELPPAPPSVPPAESSGIPHVPNQAIVQGLEQEQADIYPQEKSILHKALSLPSTAWQELRHELIPGITAAIGGTIKGTAEMGGEAVNTLADMTGVDRPGWSPTTDLADRAKAIKEGAPVVFSADGKALFVDPIASSFYKSFRHPVDAFLDRPIGTFLDWSTAWTGVGTAARGALKVGAEGAGAMAKMTAALTEEGIKAPSKTAVEMMRRVPEMLDKGVITMGEAKSIIETARPTKFTKPIYPKAVEALEQSEAAMKAALSTEREPLRIAGVGAFPRTYSENPLTKATQMGLERLAEKVPVVKDIANQLGASTSRFIPSVEGLFGEEVVPSSLVDESTQLGRDARKLAIDSRVNFYAEREGMLEELRGITKQFTPEQQEAFVKMTEGKEIFILKDQAPLVKQAHQLWSKYVKSEQDLYRISDRKVSQVAFQPLVSEMLAKKGLAPEQVSAIYDAANRGLELPPELAKSVGSKAKKAQSLVDHWTEQARQDFIQRKTYAVRNYLEFGEAKPLDNLNVKPYVNKDSFGEPMKGFEVSSDQGFIRFVDLSSSKKFLKKGEKAAKGEWLLDESAVKANARGKGFGQQLYLTGIREAQKRGAEHVISFAPSPEALRVQDALAKKGLIEIIDMGEPGAQGYARKLKATPSLYSDGEVAALANEFAPDPVYYPHIPQEDSIFSRMLFGARLKKVTPSFLKGRTGGLKDYIQDPTRAIQVHAAESLKYQSMSRMVDEMKTRYALPLENARAVLKKGDIIPGTNLRAVEDYVAFSPENLMTMYRTASQFKDDVLKRFVPGTDLTDAMYETAKVRGRTVVPGAANGNFSVYQVPKSVHTVMMAELAPWVTQNPMGQTIINAWTAATGPALDVFRKSVLNLSPRWVTNNVLGNVFNSIMGDVGPQDFMRALDSEWRGIIPRELHAGGLRRGEAVGYTGAMGETPLGKALGKAVSGIERTVALPADLNARIEDYYRSAAWLKEAAKADAARVMKDTVGMADWMRTKLDQFIGRGKFAEETAFNRIRTLVQNDKAVADSVLEGANKIMFSYNRLTSFERNVMRKVFPFWSWYRNVTRMALAIPAETPLKGEVLAGLSKIANDLNESEWKKQVGDNFDLKMLKQYQRGTVPLHKIPGFGDIPEKFDVTMPDGSKMSSDVLFPNMMETIGSGPRIRALDMTAANVLSSAFGNPGLHPIMNVMMERWVLGGNSFTDRKFSARHIFQYGGDFYRLEPGRKGSWHAVLADPPLPPLYAHLARQLPQLKLAEEAVNTIRSGGNDLPQYDDRQLFENAPMSNKPRSRSITIQNWLGLPMREYDEMSMVRKPGLFQRAKQGAMLQERRAHHIKKESERE